MCSLRTRGRFLSISTECLRRHGAPREANRVEICVGLSAMSPFHPFVPRVIRAFHDAFPLVSLRLEEWLSRELVEHLQAERVDAAFIRMSIAESEGLVINQLLEEPMVVALPSGHPLARSKGSTETGLSLKHLAHETFLLYGSPETGMGDATIMACRTAGFNPRLGQGASRFTSTLSLVATGLGISLVPASVQRMHVDCVEYRRLKGYPIPKASLNIVTRRGDHSPTVRQFLNLVKRSAKDFFAPR